MAFTESPHPGCFLLSEGPGALSRAAVTVDVPAATTLQAGTVLGRLSGTGHYAPYDEKNSDGTETAEAILIDPLENTDDAPAALAGVVIDCLAEVRAASLVWGAGVDVDGGLTDLAAKFIKARE